MQYKICKITKIAVFTIFLLAGLIAKAGADIIRLKNGYSIKGLIKSENEKNIVLDLGFGTIQLAQEEVEGIDRAGPEEAARILQEWQKYKTSPVPAKGEKVPEPQEVKFSKTSKGIVVNALLNKKVKAALILDTAASSILLSQRIGRDLGLDPAGLKKGIIQKVVMADGRQLEAGLIVLESVDVEGVEARNVEAAILLNEGAEDDGLLGRSFLNKFNFQVDAVNKKLILNRLKFQNIPEKTKYFSAICPADWERSPDSEKLVIFGPVLAGEESQFPRPYIIIEKDKDEAAVSFAKEIKKYYNRWKGSADIKHKMSELLEESLKNSYPEVEVISADFRENKDVIILGVLYLFKKYNGKIYSVKVIKKEEPLKSYNLGFFCLQQYFDEYQPVFNKCLETFASLEK